jgi:nicotinamide phosphoribosyltransferase
MKATNAVVNGVNKAIFKDPITDDGTKKSARGRIAVSYDTVKGFELKDELNQEDVQWLDDISNNWLVPVWVDGKFVRRYTFDQVKRNMRSPLPQVASEIA